MGVAAYNRASAVVSARIIGAYQDAAARQGLADALAVALECEQFTRAALAFLVDPVGMRSTSVENQKQKRGWAKRNAAMVAAHNVWTSHVPSTMARYVASVRRAQAAYALLVFALGTWTIPASIRVPRAAQP